MKVNGVDVFHPTTGEVRSDGPEGIACWFIDTDYNEESFFVRHAYFLGANDPYSALKTTLKAEINAEAWATLHSDVSRPFDKPKSGRIAVKVSAIRKSMLHAIRMAWISASTRAGTENPSKRATPCPLSVPSSHAYASRLLLPTLKEKRRCRD